MLITHRGLSGPAMLQISSYWENGQPIHIDLAPDRTIARSICAAKVRNIDAAQKAFQGILPKRFAERWLENHAPTAWNNDALAKWEEHVHNWVINPAGTEGYEKAEVTAGGVDTNKLAKNDKRLSKGKGILFIS